MHAVRPPIVLTLAGCCYYYERRERLKALLRTKRTTEVVTTNFDKRTPEGVTTNWGDLMVYALSVPVLAGIGLGRLT
jgi:hypothetical protein